MIKKKLCSICILFLFLTFIGCNVEAETLKDVKDNLAKIQQENAQNTRLTTEAKNKINAKRNAITEATNTISSNEQKVEDAKTLVAESQEKVKIKQEELQDVIDTLQYSTINSKEIYLDYVFAAESITDLMERQQIVEQIANYTKEELNNLEALIKEKESLQVKLADDNIVLNNSITEYEKQIEELDALIDKYASIGLDYNERIAAQKSVIKMYEDAGCKDGDDIDDCYTSKFANSASFSRPLNQGKVTQAWNATHGGIDLGGNTPGTNIYAPASGSIIYVANKTSCGGNIIYMHATVAGKKYTIELAHLRNMYVSSGQYVTKGTVIGTVGGDASTWYYDSCTSGAHLHYAVSYGYYFTEKGRTNWSTFKANTNATAVQNITNLKSVRGWTWSTRN